MDFRGWWIYLKEVFGYFRESPISDWDLEQRKLAMQRLEKLERMADNRIIGASGDLIRRQPKRNNR